MTAIFKVLLITASFMFVSGCSSMKTAKPLYSIKVKYIENGKIDCNMTILTEAKQKAKLTSTSNKEQCSLVAKVEDITEHGCKLTLKFKHFKNNAVAYSASPYFVTVFGADSVVETRNAKQDHIQRFVAVVQKAESL